MHVQDMDIDKSGSISRYELLRFLEIPSRRYGRWLL
jgi:hypothetical protein